MAAGSIEMVYVCFATVFSRACIVRVLPTAYILDSYGFLGQTLFNIFASTISGTILQLLIKLDGAKLARILLIIKAICSYYACLGKFIMLGLKFV